MIPKLLLPAIVVLGTSAATCQGVRTERIPAVGISISVPQTLKGLPVRLDASGSNLRMRFLPKDRKALIKTKRGRMQWSIAVYEFGSSGPATPKKEPKSKPPGTETEQQRKLRELLARRGARSRGPVRSFAAWIPRPSVKRFVTEGEAKKARGTRLAYTLWEYVTRSASRGLRAETYYAAAVYAIDGKEVAVVVNAPMPEKGDRPRGSLGGLIKRCLASGRLLKEGEGELDDHRTKDKYATTPERKRALDAAKANIESVRGWSYFTAPSYIVLYSWAPGERVKSVKFARRLVAGLEKMRKLYAKHFVPPQGIKLPYPVFRVCATYDQFRKYGGSPAGVVGWFSPRSKELVVFQGGDTRLKRKGIVEAVTYHEGWHQYSNAYFGGAELHRWFDEGFGDWFGAHKPVRSSFAYLGSHMRYRSVKTMAKKGDYVPFREIVTWPRSRFYSGRAAYYYAQAYSMIDFLQSGRKLGKKKFDSEWSNILPTYRRVMLEKKSAKAATEAAFQGVDFAAMEKAWKTWVASSKFKKPRK